MPLIETSNKEVILYYAKDDMVYKDTLDLAKVEGYAVLDINVADNPWTGSQTLELAQWLDVPLKDMLTENNKWTNDDLDTNDWLKIIRHNPSELRLPIALKGEKAVFITTPTDLLALG